MIEALLITVVVIFWLLLRPKKDWFIVESRQCTDEKLRSTAFSSTTEIDGFDRMLLAANGLTIDGSSIGVVYKAGSLASYIFARLFGVKKSISMAHKDGGQIHISQTIFQNLDEAVMYFEQMKELLPYFDCYQKLYLWRVVSRSRRKAVTLPPEQYSDKDGHVLKEAGPVKRAHLFY